MTGHQDGIRRRPRLPPNHRSKFFYVLKLPTLHLEQHAEVSALAETIEALVQFLPALSQIVNSGKAAPLRETGTNDMRAIGILAIGEPQDNSLVIDQTAAVFHGMKLASEPECALAPCSE